MACLKLHKTRKPYRQELWTEYCGAQVGTGKLFRGCVSRPTVHRKRWEGVERRKYLSCSLVTMQSFHGIMPKHLVFCNVAGMKDSSQVELDDGRLYFH